jgi:hypothetical protein
MIWSPWSACSATCGVASRSRQRTCTSPTPANGGKTCSGPETETQSCDHLAPCHGKLQQKQYERIESCSFIGRRMSSDQISMFSLAAAGLGTTTGGSWSAWSAWLECSVPCGGGVQSRQRVCHVTTSNQSCVGNTHDWRSCKMDPCPGESYVVFRTIIQSECVSHSSLQFVLVT